MAGTILWNSPTIKGSISTDTAAEILAINASGAVVKRPAINTSTFLSTALNSANLFVGNGSNIATGVALSGDISITNGGVAAIVAGVILNADINASAAIALSKLAALTASRVAITDGSGVITVSSVTPTTLAFLDATSSVQTQLNTKLSATITSVASGDILRYSGGNWVNYAVGANGTVLTISGGVPTWAAPASGNLPIGGSAGQYLNKIDGTNYNAQWSTLTLAKVTDVTATAAEVNVLDGITATTTELNYVSGVTSSIQTQLDAKQATITGAASTVVTSNLTANRIVVSNGSGKIDVSTINTTTLNYIANLTSDAQAQINSKLANNLSQNSMWIGNASNVAIQLAPGTTGYVLTSVSGVPTWQPASGGGGGITGPGSSTDDAIVLWDGVLGTAVKDSLVIVDGSGNITGATWHGNLVGVLYGGTGADLSGTGGAKNYLKQASVGAVITVGTIPASDIGSGAAITRVNDTNVTLTLGGSATTALLAAASLTLGWTGVLGLERGGTASDLSATGGTGQFLKQASVGAVITVTTVSAGEISSGAALTRTSDTNITLTLGGTPTSALLASTSITAGWSGTLAYARFVDGAGLSVVGRAANSAGVQADIAAGADKNILRRSGTSIAFGSIDLAASGAVGVTVLGLANGGTNADLSATGGTAQYLKQVSSGAAITVGTIPVTDLASAAALTKVDDTNVTLTLGGTPATALLRATSLTLGWTGTLAYARLVNGLGLSVVGRTASSSGVQSDIQGSTNTVLRVDNSGSTLGFGAVNLASGAAVTNTLPVINGGTGNTSYTAGDILIAATTLSIGSVVAVATGSVLGSAGVNTTPAYLAVSNGLTATATTLKLGGTLTGATAVTATNVNTFTFDGAWTGTASLQYGVNFAPTITGRASNADVYYGTYFNPTMTAGAISQKLNGVFIKPTFSTGGFATVGTQVLGLSSSGNLSSDILLNCYRTDGVTSVLTVNAAGTFNMGGGMLMNPATGGAAAFNGTGLLLAPVMGASNSIGVSIQGPTTSSGGTDKQVLAVGNATYNPSTGTGSVNLIQITPTWNITSSAVQVVCGVYYNPTETSMTGTTHYSFRSTSTTALGGVGTGTPTATWHVVGTTKLDGAVTLPTAGNGILIKEGTNATMGVATLVAGTVTVNTTKATTNSRIFITVQSLGTVAVATPVAVTGRVNGTSFTITSSSVTDTSVIAWLILEPA